MHTVFLRYLDEVARQGSIRKAAQILNVSSTSVNRKIINIEQQLGVMLFERSAAGVELTAAGKLVLEHSRKTLYEFQKISEILEEIRDLRSGHLSIYTIDSMKFGVLPEIMDVFCVKYPEISLSVTTAMPDQISAALVAGDADIGISFTNKLPQELRVMFERKTPFGVIVRTDHPLAGRLFVTMNDIKSYPLIRTIDARDGTSILDQELDVIANPVKTRIFSNDLTVSKQAILANHGIGVYTKLGFLKEIESQALNYVPFSAHSLSDYKVGFILPTAASIDPVKRLFLDAAEAVFKKLKLEH